MHVFQTLHSRQLLFSFFHVIIVGIVGFVACIPNCLRCSSAGANGCDNNQCNVSYGYAAESQTCKRKDFFQLFLS